MKKFFSIKRSDKGSVNSYMNIRCTKDDMKDIDRLKKKLDFKNRSEFILFMIRLFTQGELTYTSNELSLSKTAKE